MPEPDHHVLHVVVKQLRDNTSEVAERMDVAVQEALQRAAVDELGVNGPAIAQDQDEQIDRAGAAVGFADLEVGPVDLGLHPGHGLEADVRKSGLLLFDRPNQTLHRLIAPGIAEGLRRSKTQLAR
jgi:hypothetical protein